MDRITRRLMARHWIECTMTTKVMICSVMHDHLASCAHLTYDTLPVNSNHRDCETKETIAAEAKFGGGCLCLMFANGAQFDVSRTLSWQ